VEALSYYQIRLEHMIMHGIVPDLKSHERSEWVQRTVTPGSRIPLTAAA
jgi:hypothetical protein